MGNCRLAGTNCLRNFWNWICLLGFVIRRCQGLEDGLDGGFLRVPQVLDDVADGLRKAGVVGERFRTGEAGEDLAAALEELEAFGAEHSADRLHEARGMAAGGLMFSGVRLRA